MRLVRLIVRLENGKLLEDSEEIISPCLQPSRIMFQHVTTLCACHGHSPSICPKFGDTKQPMGEGKSGPVETGLAEPVATALCTESEASLFCLSAYCQETKSTSRRQVCLEHTRCGKWWQLTTFLLHLSIFHACNYALCSPLPSTSTLWSL